MQDMWLLWECFFPISSILYCQLFLKEMCSYIANIFLMLRIIKLDFQQYNNYSREKFCLVLLAPNLSLLAKFPLKHHQLAVSPFDGKTARRSNQSILKEISPGCSLEGLMLKLKLQYFGHLMQRVGSLEKTLMLGGIGGRRRRGR